MANPGLTKTEARRTQAAVEKALKAGHPRTGDARRRSAAQIAAAALRISEDTVKRRVKPNGPLARMGMSPDWRLYKAPAKSAAAPDLEGEREKVAASDRIAELERRVKASHREALTEETLRARLFDLAREPLRPQPWALQRDGAGNAREAVILAISDLHWGERIALDAMGGRNAYDPEIARKRLRRLFENVVKLGTLHWSGPPPAVIYVALLGDLISGEIHEELAKTNDLLAIPAARDLSTQLISGLDLLAANFACEIRVISTPGNHGRVTRKPEAKRFAIESYDTLVAWTLERWYAAKGDARISFSAPVSGDALVSINGWNVLFTHGDRIGSRGGAGFIGPAATAARGMQRVIQDYAVEGVIVDRIVMGHFHTPLELEQGFVNGCLAGPSEYSRSGRMRSHPASQWMLSVHPRRCPARRWLIDLGAPEEGSIYRDRAIGQERATA